MNPENEGPYEISQDEEIELWMLLSQVRKELLMVSDRELKKRFGISTVQLGILAALYTAHEAGVAPSLSDLSRWVIRKHNTVSVTLTGMETRGLVRIERGSEGKRSVIVHITDSGRELYDHIQQKRKHIREILGALNPEERRSLAGLLRKLDQKSREILFKGPFA